MNDAHNDDGAAELASEPSLWEQAANGLPHARERLFAHADRVVRAELRRRGLRAGELDDVAQRALLGVLRFLDGGGPVKDLDRFLKYRAWGALSEHRRSRRTLEHERTVESSLGSAETEPGEVRDPGGHALRRELVAALEACIALLAENHSRVFKLRYDEGHEADEIARAVGVQQDTVNVQLFRARRQVRECLVKKGFGGGDLP